MTIHEASDSSSRRPHSLEAAGRIVRCFVAIAAGWGMLGSEGRGAAAEAPPERLNILLLYADDWRFDTLGCAGNPVVKTPRLDKLASEGVRFAEARVTTSICGVSRATLFTGQWMSRHGNFAFDAFKTPWAETFPGILRDSGYWTGHVGKWHNGVFPKEKFDFGRAYSGKHFLPGKKDEHGEPVHVTRQNELDALEFLRDRPQGKPFCLTVAFFATHAEDANPLQFLPQKGSEKLYQDVTIPTPSSANEEAFRKLPPFVGVETNEGRRRWRWRFDAPEKYQQMMKNYYRLATEVDATCGRILDELEKQGEAGRTLVIFTTDNGYFHGEHGLADKWYPYQESIRVPLIVRDPRRKADAPPKVDDALVLNVDLAPTILAAAQAPVPARMQGVDFSPLYLQAERPQWRDEYFYEHPTIKNKAFIPASQALVRKDEKYLYWPEFDYEQIFDLKKDPLELDDLFPRTSKERVAELRGPFEKLRDAAK